MTDFLASVAESANSSKLVDQLLEQIATRLQAGDAIDLSAYIREYPEQAERLRRLLPTMLAVAEFGKSTESGGMGVPSPDSSSLSGTLGDFRIVREIGRGGMGIVYEAEQISLARRVALKVLPFAATLDPRQLQRFKNEAQAAAAFHHPHIVPVFFVGCERGVHFYAMQLVEGRTLAAVIKELRCSDPAQTSVAASDSSWSVDSGATARTPQAAVSTVRCPRGANHFRLVAEIGVQAAEALEYAHRLGIIHRDIKPSNLLLDASNHVWVTDFGLAYCQSSTSLTMTGDIVGTLKYMSPEQALAKPGNMDHRTDIYSLGATLYELATLRPVFTGRDRQELLQQIALEEPRSLRRLDKSIPHDLDVILLKALAKDPECRYTTVQELADDLRRYLGHQPVRATRPGSLQIMQKWTRRHASLVSVVAAALLLLTVVLCVATVLLWNERRQTQAALIAARTNYESALAHERQVEKYDQEMRQRLYAADMRLAFQAFRNYDLPQTIDLLGRWTGAGNQEDIRGFEWHYLWSLCHRERLVQRAHTGEVYWVAFSPDGRRLVTAGEDATARLWDAGTGHDSLALRGHRGAVRSAAFLPDGRTVVTASDDKTLKLWDAATGQLVQTFAGHTGDLRCLAVSPDGTWLASGGLDNTARLWDIASGEMLSVFQGHEHGVRGAAFSPDGSTLATAAGDYLVKLWDLKKRDEQATLRGHITWLSGVAFSPDGKALASCCWGPMIKVWDVTTRRERYEVAEHTNDVLSVAFSPNGATLLSASRDGTVREWEVASGRAKGVLQGHLGTVWCAAYSPDGQTIATAGADGSVRLWDRDAQAGFVRLPIDWPTMPDPVGGAFCLSSSVVADGGQLAYFTSLDRTLRILDLKSGLLAKITFGRGDADFKCLAISPDGRIAASGTRAGLVQLWDLPSGQQRLMIRAHPYYVHSLAFSPDGQFLASGDIGMDLPSTYQASVLVWEVATGKQRHDFLLPGNSGVRDLAFSPDGQFVASSSDGQHRALVWRLADGQQHLALAGHTGPTSAVRFSPDGKLIATGSDDHTVRLWDATSGQLRSTMRGHTGNITNLQFSPDGRTLVSSSADNSIRLWHTATGGELTVLYGHNRGGVFVAFCCNGRALASLGYDELFLWPTEGVIAPDTLEP